MPEEAPVTMIVDPLGNCHVPLPCHMRKTLPIFAAGKQSTGERPPLLRTVVAIRRVLTDMLGHFNDDDGWSMASHLAITALMALFPFLIFATTLASFLGAQAFTETAVHLVFDTWPEQIADPIAQEVVNVLTVQRSRPSDLWRAACRFLRLQRDRGAAHLAEPRIPGDGDPQLPLSPRPEPGLRADCDDRLPGDQRAFGARAADRADSRCRAPSGSVPIWEPSRCGGS